jgi:drug/metabolite transporter (DMT)-like permease
MGAAASLAWFTAYAMQGAGPVRTLGMVEVVFSYLVSRRLLSEALNRNEKIGMGLMLVGLVLICLQGCKAQRAAAALQAPQWGL